MKTKEDYERQLAELKPEYEWYINNRYNLTCDPTDRANRVLRAMEYLKIKNGWAGKWQGGLVL